MTVRKGIFTLVFSLFCSVGAWAQVTDAGFWAGADYTLNWNKRLSFNGELQGRFGQGFTRYQRSLVDLGGDYKINSYLRFSATYRFGHVLHYDGREYLRQRVNTDLRLRLKSEKIKYDFRLRYQAGRRNTDELGQDLREGLRFKSKMTMKVARKTHFSPAFEVFFSDRNGESRYSDWRVRLDFKREVAKRRELRIGYLVQSEVNRRNPLTEHMIVVGYSIESKRKQPKK